jgi:putative membrane protein
MKTKDDGDGEGRGASRARDHLANERTYLAWLRTGANVMKLGLAIAKFVEGGNRRAIAAGIVLIVVGALGVVEGAVRYRRVNREIERGGFATGSRGREPVIAGVVLIIAVGA